MASEGLPVQPAVRALGCSESGSYASLVRAPRPVTCGTPS